MRHSMATLPCVRIPCMAPHRAHSASSFSDPRAAIIASSLRHVGSHGWSRDALAAGARDCGYPAVAHGMLIHESDLIHAVLAQSNAAMSEHLSSLDLRDMSVNERIKAGVLARLHALSPYLRVWPEAMALGAHPTALPHTLKLIAVASDEIWWHAGDRSTDAVWYTRRALLGGILAASEVFAMTDTSPQRSDTSAFLDRALQDVTRVGSAGGELLATLTAAGGGVGAILTSALEPLRPCVLAPGAALTRAAGMMPPLMTAPAAGGVLDALTSAASPLVSLAAAAARGVESAAKQAGVTLPEPPPMLAALLAVATSSGGGSNEAYTASQVRYAPPPASTAVTVQEVAAAAGLNSSSRAPAAGPVVDKP